MRVVGMLISMDIEEYISRMLGDEGQYHDQKNAGKLKMNKRSRNKGRHATPAGDEEVRGRKILIKYTSIIRTPQWTDHMEKNLILKMLEEMGHQILKGREDPKSKKNTKMTTSKSTSLKVLVKRGKKRNAEEGSQEPGAQVDPQVQTTIL